MAKNPNEVMRPQWYTIESFKKRFPENWIIVNEVVYRKDTQDYKIEETNEAYEFMCAQMKVDYLQINTNMPQNRYDWDGIHLNRAGTEVLAKIIQDF